MKSFMRLPNLKELTEEDVLKFVVSSKTDLEDMKEIIIKYFPRGGPKFYVSPVWGKIEPRELVEYVRKENWQKSACRYSSIKLSGSRTGEGSEMDQKNWNRRRA